MDFSEIKEKAEYCLNCKNKPCTKGCPLKNNIPEFIKYIKEGRYKDAYGVLSETTVLSAVCGRVCPHNKQCQGNCVRGIKGEPVFIGELEAFIGDMAIKEGWKIGKEIEDLSEGSSETFVENKEKQKINGFSSIKKVAVVGSGPAGLTCAAFLTRKGYKVTIYEKHEKLGGLLRYGIPAFRLDREILDKQISKILEIGIETICGKELGKDIELDELKENYDAVFLCFGANISRKMNVPGENLNGVFGGNELLEYGKNPNYKGKKVAVIGGGNVAMDVSRMIKRLGADKVYVVYRRAEEQMPAEKKEIEMAKKEGIEFLFQSNVIRVNGKEDKSKKIDFTDEYKDVFNSEVCGIECVKTKLVHKEGSDRLVPVDIDGSNFIMDVDFVVMAIGAEAEGSVLSKLGLELNKLGYVSVDENYMTSIPNVFAGGDLIGNKATVAWAARNGIDVAYMISSII